MRPLIAEIDSDALRHNFRRLAQRAGRARLMTLLKAQAYGHDALIVTHALAALSEKLAVACLDEARELRRAGIQTPILVLQGFYSLEEWQEGLRLGDIEWALHTRAQWDAIRTRREAGTLWLKINTGMGRLGLPQSDTLAMIQAIRDSAHHLTGVMTHYACADEPNSPHWQTQRRNVSALADDTPHDLAFSASNSAAIFNGVHPREDWVRPGISLFGWSPFADRSATELGLRPAMRLRSEVIAVNAVPAGATVGYGATWTAQRDSRIAVIAAGYGDGYPRHARHGTPVWIDGRILPLAGRVSMDMLTVDVTGHPDISPGAQVELWGPHLSADIVARHADTISYTLTTGLTARVPRHLQQ